MPPAPPDLASRIRRALDAEDARALNTAGESRVVPADAPIGAHTIPAALNSEGESPPPLGLRGVRILPMKARYAVPAAAAAVALAVVGARMGGNPTDDPNGPIVSGINGTSYLEDVVDRHWRGHPAEVSGPPTQVTSWFRGKIQFPVRPVEFGNPNVRFVGARISSVRDRDAAAFYYDVSGRRVTVLVFEPPAPIHSSIQQTTIGGHGLYYGRAHGYTVPVIERGGLTYAFTGDLEPRQVEELAASAHVQDR
jgi:hypothetical protein